MPEKQKVRMQELFKTETPTDKTKDIWRSFLTLLDVFWYNSSFSVKFPKFFLCACTFYISMFNTFFISDQKGLIYLFRVSIDFLRTSFGQSKGICLLSVRLSRAVIFFLRSMFTIFIIGNSMITLPSYPVFSPRALPIMYGYTSYSIITYSCSC